MGIRSNFEKNWSEPEKYHHRAVPRSAVPGSAAGTVFGFAVCHADSGEQYVSEGCGTRYGFAPKTVLTLDQEMTAYNMTCAGLGASFVSDTLVKGAMPHPNVVYYKLSPEFASQTIYFYYKRNRYIPKCMSEFLEMLDQKQESRNGRDRRPEYGSAIGTGR